ncbi:hypothetical protein MVEN_01432800 [Mycena venus]|uniref:Uncharacterized protein n=1 Tax=Mycena venus TaxID=2733690 RepID=A0A8H7CV32_9AGAR|nr:hypothetical protein MVEN_01432800 [Mycena venus]
MKQSPQVSECEPRALQETTPSFLALLPGDQRARERDRDRERVQDTAPSSSSALRTPSPFEPADLELRHQHHYHHWQRRCPHQYTQGPGRMQTKAMQTRGVHGLQRSA